MALIAIDRDAGPLQDTDREGNLQSTWSVTASTPQGEVYVHEHAFPDEARAQRFATRVNAAGFINPDHWHFWRTIYGTAAFEAEEEEAYMAKVMIMRGHAREDDFSDNIRTLL